MTRIKQLHDQAMCLAEQADIANLNGDPKKSDKLILDAFILEKEAASLWLQTSGGEPTLSILHRSAAALALQCGRLREAEQLISIALSGHPLEEIADELRDLLEQVYFQRHLELRGVSLCSTEVQLAIAGKGIGFGIAPSEECIERVQSFEKLVYRTAERNAGVNYRERGGPSQDIKDRFEVFISVPRAASFAVTMRVGRKREQLNLDFAKPMRPGDIIDEIVNCLEKVNDGAMEELENHINNKPYFNNFIALARKIAPDGEDVNFVGLTVRRRGQKQELAFTKVGSDLGKPYRQSATNYNNLFNILQESSSSHNGILVEVDGFLKYADSTEKTAGKTKLIDKQENEHHIVVPEGVMGDIVRFLWDHYVRVTGVVENSDLVLHNIRRLKKIVNQFP